MLKNDFYYEGMRKELIPLIPKVYFRVLEIGCGDGSFRNNLLPTCEYWGVEPNEEISKICSERLDKVCVGTFDEVYDILPNAYFDLIICNDVIEHMLDHHLFLEKVKHKMVNDAVIIGSIPNVRYILNLYNLLIYRDWKYVDEGILDRTHLRFFTLKSAEEAFKTSGYDIEELYGINRIWFSKRTRKGLFMLLLQFIFGKDTKFLQFAFKIKVH